MENTVKKFIEWLFKHSQNMYTNMFKHHKSWRIYHKELLSYPDQALGKFLDENGFELIEKIEGHDAYNTLTGFCRITTYNNNT
nr:hypothetical protein [uncultured Psychroserpens sp.]